MPTFAEVRAYILGVRLAQSRKLASTSSEPVVVHRGLLRLRAAISALLGTAMPEELVSRLNRLLQVATNSLELSAPIAWDLLDESYELCRRQLEMTESVLRSWASTLSPNEYRIGLWLTLGLEIVRGEGGDEPPPVMNPPTRRAWQWDSLDQLHARIDAAEASIDSLFPQDKPDQEWFDPLPLRWLEWLKIERGIDGLLSSAAPDRCSLSSARAISAEEQEKKRSNSASAAGRRASADGTSYPHGTGIAIQRSSKPGCVAACARRHG